MKKLSRQLSRRVLKELNKDQNFKDVYQMVSNKSKTKPYLVGGKLYRTLVEIMYDYPARSRSADFDFAAEEIRESKKKKKGRIKLNANGVGASFVLADSDYSGESIKMTSAYGCPIDLINIPDLKGLDGATPDINGYLTSVPLSIQSIAMDLEKCIIFGKVGIESLNERFVWINNQGALDGLVKHKRWGNGDLYIQDKAKSIRFGWDKKVRAPKKDNGYNPSKSLWDYNFSNSFTLGNGDWASTETINWNEVNTNTIVVGDGTVAPAAEVSNQVWNDMTTHVIDGALHATIGGITYQLIGNDWQETNIVDQ